MAASESRGDQNKENEIQQAAKASSPAPQTDSAVSARDNNIYCRRPDGEIYAILTPREWSRLRNAKKLNRHLESLR